MDGRELLEDAFGRIPDAVREAVEGLPSEALVWQPAPGTNPIGWLVWHLTRVQDDHVAELAGGSQVWDDEWAARFGLPAGTRDTGYGHTPEQVASVRPETADVLLDYLTAVTEATQRFLATVTGVDLDRVVDTSWDPPVTMGVRLVSVLDDDVQHAGQLAYLRGLLDRWTDPN
jgi:uncharacterized damage-inducible protein DinB